MDKRIFALGFFDGVHLGHQALLKECVTLAEQLGCETAAITFEKHPKALFLPTPPALINSIEDRTGLLRENAMEQIRKKYGNQSIVFGASHPEKEEDPLP